MTLADDRRVRPAPTAGAPLAALVAGGLIAFVIPGLLLDVEVGERPSLVAAAIMAVSGARFSWLFGAGLPRLMELSFWTFTYVFLGLAPLVQIQTDRYPGTTPWFDRTLVDDALMAFLISTCLVLAGATLAGHRPSRAARIHIGADVSHTRVHLLAMGALVANAAYVARVGPATLLASREELRAVQTSYWPETGLGVLVVAVCTMPLLVAFLGLLQLRAQSGRGRRGWNLVLLLATGSALVFSVNLISSPRYLAGTVALAMAAGLGAYSTPRRIRVMSVTFLGGFALLFPLADAFRREGPASEVFDPARALTTGDFDALIQMTNALQLLPTRGIEWGAQLLGVPLFWVPRTQWPGKPVGTGALIAEEMGYPFTNLSSPLPMELLVNGGWPLLVVGMLATGVWLRARDDAMVAAVAHRVRPSVWSWILPFYLLILVRGSLQSAAVQLSVILVAYWVIRARSSHAPEDGPRDRTSAEPGTDEIVDSRVVE